MSKDSAPYLNGVLTRGYLALLRAEHREVLRRVASQTSCHCGAYFKLDNRPAWSCGPDCKPATDPPQGMRIQP